MSWGLIAVAGATLVGGVMSSDAQRKAGNKAADAQSAAAQSGIDEQRRQFDAIQSLLKPYVDAGQPALTGQQDLVGLNGNAAQGAAISAIQGSPMFTSMLQQGENSILQNASATGGLRGGNTQAALAQFSPQLLAQIIDQQYSRLGGMTELGQNSAVGVGKAGMQTGNEVSGLLLEQGAARAGGALSQGKADIGYAGALTRAIGSFAGYGGFGQSGGSFGAYDPSGYGMTRPGINLPTRGGF